MKYLKLLENGRDGSKPWVQPTKWRAEYHSQRFKQMDTWQMNLLHQYARIAGQGAASPINLEV